MTLWNSMQATLWRARTEYDMSLLHRARGDIAAADRAKTRALQVFRDCGSRAFAALAGHAANSADPDRR